MADSDNVESASGFMEADLTRLVKERFLACEASEANQRNRAVNGLSHLGLMGTKHTAWHVFNQRGEL